MLRNCKSDIDFCIMMFYFCEIMTQSTSQKYQLIIRLKNKIQMLEWPAYSPYLNPTENVWANIKCKLGSNAYKKIQSLKLDIEEYCISCVTNLISIISNSIRKKIWCINFK